jgi:putative tricarboxylic transport membrane protein
MKRYDAFGGIFWLIFGFLVSGISRWDLGLGSLAQPESGLFPFIVGIIMAIVALALTIMAWASRKRDPAFTEMPSFSRTIPVTFGVLCIYALILESLGYLISTSILLVYLLKFSASVSWKMSLLVTAAVMVASYYFFVVLLQSQLPAGVLESILR